jgi:hypothetical protein
MKTFIFSQNQPYVQMLVYINVFSYQNLIFLPHSLQKFLLLSQSKATSWLKVDAIYSEEQKPATFSAFSAAWFIIISVERRQTQSKRA